jgi:hypothetical protein
MDTGKKIIFQKTKEAIAKITKETLVAPVVKKRSGIEWEKRFGPVPPESEPLERGSLDLVLPTKPFSAPQSPQEIVKEMAEKTTSAVMVEATKTAESVLSTPESNNLLKAAAVLLAGYVLGETINAASKSNALDNIKQEITIKTDEAHLLEKSTGANSSAIDNALLQKKIEQLSSLVDEETRMILDNKTLAWKVFNSRSSEEKS